jgi:ABC-type oligopeptide transport system substrate-binding subunit
LADLQKEVMEDLPMLPLFRQKTVLAASKKVRGLETTIFENLDARFAWLKS